MDRSKAFGLMDVESFYHFALAITGLTQACHVQLQCWNEADSGLPYRAKCYYICIIIFKFWIRS